MGLSSTSMAAASMLTQNITTMQAAVAPAGQNPTPAAASAESQAAVRPQISASVLKASLSIEATTAAEMSQMISQGSGVNILA